MYATRVLLRQLSRAASFVASLLLTSCWAAPPPPDPMCLRLATVRPCPVDAATESPEHLQSRRQSLVKTGDFAVLSARTCPRSIIAAVRASSDACIANYDAVLPQAVAEANARRLVAGPAVASLRADARFAPAREKHHKAVILHAAACSANYDTVTEGCRFAANDVHDAREVMLGLFAEHHIDVRDAEALELW